VTMAGEEFLGRGFAFPVRTDDRHRFATASGEEDVRQAIRLVLDTVRGERVMRPRFGCGIHDYAFETVNTSTLTLIKESVREALVEWEPRIRVRNVDVSTAELSQGRLLVTVEYRVRESNAEGNLVYPFYLEEGPSGL